MTKRKKARAVGMYEQDRAMAKMVNALTPRQVGIVRELILLEAVQNAEASAEGSEGKHVRQLMPHTTLRSYPHSAQKMIDMAVYWYHERHKHYWKVDPETGKQTMM